MNRSRRTFLLLAAAVVLTACAAPDTPERTEISKTSIHTPAGTFDALTAGPKDGRKVMLLHGFPEFALAWEQQLLALGAAGYHAVAPDQRGYSPGVRPEGVENYRLDLAVGDLFAMADSLGWSRFDLVGHDWGAAVGWIAAAEQPKRIQTFTAVAVPHLGAFADALRTDPAQQQASGYLAMFRQPSPIPENQILGAGPPELPGVPAARSEEYFRRLSEPGALTAALNWYRANDFTGYEQPVTVPTLFIAGTEDATVAQAGVLATRNWVTGAYHLENLDGLGHNIPEQAPKVTNRLLLNHLHRW